MATIRKRVNKKGVSWQVDYYDPQKQAGDEVLQA